MNVKKMHYINIIPDGILNNKKITKQEHKNTYLDIKLDGASIPKSYTNVKILGYLLDIFLTMIDHLNNRYCKAYNAFYLSKSRFDNLHNQLNMSAVIKFIKDICTSVSAEKNNNKILIR